MYHVSVLPRGDIFGVCYCFLQRAHNAAYIVVCTLLPYYNSHDNSGAND